ncbi:MAG TPA: LytR C-terminal domain-containing protein [Mycobacteriales bacterium]|nr:LytR C-terminal domain-containing protein [Mycobacteriales bacterium]
MTEWGPGDGPPSGFASPAGGRGSGGGRHRAPAQSGPTALSRLVAPLIAVAVVAAAVGVLVLVRGHSSGSGPGAGVIVAPTVTPATTPSPTSTSAPTPSVTITHPPPTPTVSIAHTGPPRWRTAMAPVRVFNSTHITGMAHQVAAQIAAKGWTVPVVGNTGAVSSVTTLYYSPRAHDAARHLARQFSGIGRIRPNREAKLDYHGLTLILTADWHG